MKNCAVLVVDLQNALIEKHPYKEQTILQNVQTLLSAARASAVEVIYVRHDDGKGSDLEAGTDGWQIHSSIAPLPNEKIFEKTFNSAFHKTQLNAYLKRKNINTLILVGMQTEYCIDATCKSAFDLDYKLIMPQETNTTVDSSVLSAETIYHFYNFTIWKNRFAEVAPLETILKKFQKTL